jgi:hypothetical protein
MNLARIAICALAVSGCAVDKEWIPTGGSRADGVVRLGYEYGSLQVPHVNNARATELARQKCGNWGYTGAEAFGAVQRRCVSADEYGGCNTYRVTAEFQCTGQPEKQ